MAVTIFKCFMQIIPNPYNNTKKIDFVSSILELRKVSSVSASDFPRLYSKQPQGWNLSLLWFAGQVGYYLYTGLLHTPVSQLPACVSDRLLDISIWKSWQCLNPNSFPPAPSWWCDHLFSHPGHHLRLILTLPLSLTPLTSQHPVVTTGCHFSLFNVVRIHLSHCTLLLP